MVDIRPTGTNGHDLDELQGARAHAADEVAEANLAIHARNERRGFRREEGEEGVSDDEDFVEEPEDGGDATQVDGRRGVGAPGGDAPGNQGGNQDAQAPNNGARAEVNVAQNNERGEQGAYNHVAGGNNAGGVPAQPAQGGASSSALDGILEVLPPEKVNDLLRLLAAPRQENPSIPAKRNQDDATATSSSKETKTDLTLDFVMGERHCCDTKVEAHPSLVSLLTNGHYLPLTLCTTDALQLIQRQPGSIKYIKFHDRQGAKKELLDIAAWPAEDQMSKEDWNDAWKNFVLILARAASARLVKAFKEHYEYLVDSTQYRKTFTTVLTFDIEFRQNFLTGKKGMFEVGDTLYLKRFADVGSEVILDHQKWTDANVARNASSNGGQSSGGKAYGAPAAPRFNPYERKGHTDKAGQSQSFRQKAGQATPSGIICLICGQGGHRAKQCGRTTTTGGKATYATWHNEKLVAVVSRHELCVIWNLSGKTPCRGSRCPGEGGHVCSLCGTAGHHASEKRCL